MNCKKLFSWSLIAALVCAGTAVFAQKATTSYWGGQVQRKTYEPYYYELVKLQDDLETDDTIYFWKNTLGIKTGTFPPSVCTANTQVNTKQQRREYLSRLASARKKDVGELEARYAQVDKWMAGNSVLQHWAVALGPNDNDDLNHMTGAQWTVVQKVFSTQPKQRDQRPEPVQADKITTVSRSGVHNEHVFVTFKAADGKYVYMRFNLAARNVEIYNAFNDFWRTIKGKRTDLNDLKDWRKK